MTRTGPPPRVLALAALLVLGGTGCFRALEGERMRAELLQTGLIAQRFAVTPDQGFTRIEGQRPVSHRHGLSDAWTAGCIPEACFRLVAVDGGSRVTTEATLSEGESRAIWQPLDAESLTTFKAGLADAVERRLFEEDTHFTPRFGLTGGVFYAAGTGLELGFGVRAGLRRWQEPEVLGSLVAEYEWLGAPSPARVALLARVEFARWSTYSERFAGAPSASWALVVGATGQLAAQVRPGLRAGVGLHLNDFIGHQPLPLFFELTETTTFAGSAPSLGVRFAVGFGL